MQNGELTQEQEEAMVSQELANRIVAMAEAIYVQKGGSPQNAFQRAEDFAKYALTWVPPTVKRQGPIITPPAGIVTPS